MATRLCATSRAGPAARGRARVPKAAGARWSGTFGFQDEAEALAYKGNPVDSLEPLAKAGIPLLHVVGDADDVGPGGQNTAIIEERYKALGGSITVIHKPSIGARPTGADDTAPVVAFLLKHAGDAARDLGVILPLGDSITHGVGGRRLSRRAAAQARRARGFTLRYNGSIDAGSTPELKAAGQERHDGHSGFIIDGRDLFRCQAAAKGVV